MYALRKRETDRGEREGSTIHTEIQRENSVEREREAASIVMAVAYASSMARAGLMPRVSTASLCSRLPALPCLPSRSVSTSVKHSSASNRLAPFQIKASPSEDSSDSVEVGEVFSGMKDKWDALENKFAFILYGGGAIVVLWLSSVIVGAINSVPVVPKAMELVGVGYTGWFVYRYLLFKTRRKELAAEIEGLKKKIAGSE